MTSGIYQITNSVTNQSYIGSAVNLTKRKHGHLDDLRKGIHTNKRLQNSFNKYGEAAFRWTTLLIVEDATLLIASEQSFIDLLNPFFNICRIAGSQLGMKHTDAAKLKMRLRKLGISTWNKGIPHSEAFRKRLSDAKPKNPVVRIDPSTGERKYYDSASAARPDGFHCGNIGKCCRGEQPNHKGFFWEYTSDRLAPDAASRQYFDAFRNTASGVWTKKAVVRIDKTTGDKKQYESVRATERDGFNAAHVSACCCRNRRTHKGFFWEFAT